MAGSDKITFNPGETNIPLDLNEENMEYDPDVEQEFGTGSSWNFDEKIKKGDKVILDPDNDGTVKKAPAGAKEIIGKVISTPEWKGTRPTSNKTGTDAILRAATVEVMGSHVVKEQLEPQNKAVTVNDNIIMGATTKNCVDKADSENNTRTLTSAPANSGDTVVVVYGFYGKLED